MLAAIWSVESSKACPIDLLDAPPPALAPHCQGGQQCAPGSVAVYHSSVIILGAGRYLLLGSIQRYSWPLIMRSLEEAVNIIALFAQCGGPKPMHER